DPVNTVPGIQTVQENRDLIFAPGTLNGLRVSDADSFGQEIRVTLTVTDGILLTRSVDNVFVAGNGTSVVTITGLDVTINALLDLGVTYRPTSNFSGNATLTIATSDLGAIGLQPQTDVDTVTIQVLATPNAPVATHLNQTRVYLDGATNVSLADIVVTDADGDLITATLTLSSPSSGSLSTSHGAVYESGTGIWSVTGSVNDVNLALANVVFQPVANNINEVTITTRIRDAANTGPADGLITLRCAQLTASDATQTAGFGLSVDADGNRVVVGAYQADTAGGHMAGAAYVYERTADGAWVEAAILTASNGRDLDNFGRFVAISGDRIVVTAPAADGSVGVDVGTVYVYSWNGSSWIETQLSPFDGAASDWFGISADIDGDTIIVGSYFDDDKGSASGSVYVYQWSGSDWVYSQKLTASDGAANDQFGNSVAVDGQWMIIGSHLDDDTGSNSGSAYLFQWNGTSWVQHSKFQGTDTAANDYFGFSVDIDGDVAVVGAYLNDALGTNAGAAYVLRWDGAQWGQSKLSSPGISAIDQFGISVAVDGDTVVVGAHGDDNNGVGDIGNVFAYRWDGTNWVARQIQPLVAETGLLLGRTVAISGNWLLAGAYTD
ncbi:MAG: FG-GAP repeat protein, partial [Pirellula sp.]